MGGEASSNSTSKLGSQVEWDVPGDENGVNFQRRLQFLQIVRNK